MDFTLITYRSLLLKLKQKSYAFPPFKEYIQSSINNHKSSIIILRHDVDRLPANALQMAKLESDLGIKGTYYFRIVLDSYDENIITQIAEMGHEIGYHYEDVDLVNKNSYNQSIIHSFNQEMLIDLAYESFCINLEKFRKIYPVKTICMHGSPLSKYDNKIIWEKYNYRDLGIIGEPYFDIDFNEFAYFTDTGRRWNGNNVNVRDKVTSRYNFNFKSTKDIIDNIDKLPDKIMFTIHPQRWHGKPFLWIKELVMQNIKNVVKKAIVSMNN